MMPSNETTAEVTQRETVSDTVFHGVADAEGVSPLDLQPLGEVIDTDALNRVIASTGDSTGASRVLSFAYSGYEVTVCGDESVSLSELDDDTYRTPH